jgi:transketolase
MNNRGNKSTRLGFGAGVVNAAMKNHNVVVLGADITSSVGLAGFKQKFPDRFFSLGIAEQNGIGVSVGMALCGKIPVFSSYAAFSAHRTMDQIRVSACYNHAHIIIGGAHSGITVGPDGATHQALEDIAAMRVLPGMTVLSPCDATQAELLTEKAILEWEGPVYIRYGKTDVPDFTTPEMKTQIGKGQLLSEGKDLCIIATGHMVWESLQAADLLRKQGIEASVINIHTIKPIDAELIIEQVKKCKKIVTAEEHQIAGGLGSVVAEITSEKFPVPILRIGINDCFGESGEPEELLAKYKLNAAGICNKILDFLDNGN